MVRRRLAATVALAVLLYSTDANAEPEAPQPLPSDHVKLTSSPGVLRILSTGLEVHVPQGSHLLTPPSWDKLDAELRRLQAVETRLTAENGSLRKTMEGWKPGWKTLAVTFLVGAAGGVYLHQKLN